ncbi:MAG: 8-oxo-dGTP diphosphatase [Candidatus Aenigmarchaeota archaeon]|nr:8-oxo-dGTP diphosphatase [Candidatus Aenigmarchaeota archaeon]
MTTATLCYVIKAGKVLLIQKKRGFGAGKWNGPGGKVGMNEDIAEAASREVLEETGIVPDNPRKAGELEFFFGQYDVVNWHVHVFVADDYDGIEKETKEAAPKWFPVSKVPYKDMWPDDAVWMPLMLSGRKFHGRFYFDKDAKKLLKHEVREL